MTHRLSFDQIEEAYHIVARFLREHSHEFGQRGQLYLEKCDKGRQDATTFEVAVLGASDSITQNPRTVLKLQELVPGAVFKTRSNSDRTQSLNSIAFDIGWNSAADVPACYRNATTTSRGRSLRGGPPSILLSLGMLAGAALMLAALSSA